MRTSLLTLILALMLAQGFALKCNYCVPKSGTRCIATVETCEGGKDSCISTRLTIPPYMGFRRCGSTRECLLYQGNTAMISKCCKTDLCNPVIF
ncbi:phospholipase A2 inhibitor and Ly6/PLAUR domain-containing protein-like [Triplophysa dalaica]|uniref:phospholipase A2 inhibitor and Ly6/PLAUR domain-containing protein-like n=1 Tax=Triplophysa dalaica TaxID=1582913 RepID=UPI0024E038D8|nr:phospholipase A2 inhibitor and Ly6/PLAUR domain-containing protein-like [Triplophysa dalaica]